MGEGVWRLITWKRVAEKVKAVNEALKGAELTLRTNNGLAPGRRGGALPRDPNGVRIEGPTRETGIYQTYFWPQKPTEASTWLQGFTAGWGRRGEVGLELSNAQLVWVHERIMDRVVDLNRRIAGWRLIEGSSSGITSAEMEKVRAEYEAWGLVVRQTARMQQERGLHG